MKELRHTEEREAIRNKSFRESIKRGVFIDEFGQENPHVGIGSYRPATKGKLAEPEKRRIAMDFISSLELIRFREVFQKLEEKYGSIIALQFMDDEFVNIIKEEFGAKIDLKAQQIHEWFGE